MSEHISDDRLEELIAMASNVPDLHSALLELQERRKAEQCRKCEGLGILHYGNPPEQTCHGCNGTGRKSALTAIYEIAARELAEPGDHSGLLVSICTLIEDGPVSGWEPERQKEYGIRSKVDGTYKGPMQSCTPEDEARSWAREFPEAYVPVWRYAAGEWKGLK